MASPTSDLKFPEMIQTISGFRCGAAYRYNVVVSSDQDHYLNMAQIKHIDLSDLVENIQGITYEREVMSFSNGGKILAVFELKDELVTGFGLSLYCTLKAKKPNGTFTTLGTYQPQVVGGGWGIGYCPANLAKTYGVDFYIVCHFDYWQDVETVPGVTGMDGITFSFLVPSRCSQYPDAIRSNAQKTEDTVYSLQHGTDGRPHQLPSDWYYPTDTVPVLGFDWKFTDFEAFTALISDPNDPINPDDIFKRGDMDEPIQETDPSAPGGGGGGYDAPSDPIDFPNLPTGGALASRAVRAYCPTSQELYNLFQRLWDTSIFDVDTFQKLVDNPMDAIVSLHAIPVTPSIGSRALHVFIGNFNTEIAMDTIDNQYLTVDCGYINTEEFWGSALDYNPYTKSSIYLPFIGIKDLNTDDVMKKNIRVKYNIDVLNGDCIAFVKCGTAVLYKFSGSLKQDIPVTGQQSNVQLKGLQATLAEAGGAVMGGAIGGPMGAAIGAGAVLSAVSSVISSKITTQRTGNITGNHGILDDYRPYLIFHRPIQSLAKDFKTFKGYPSNITAQLSSLSGYTEVEYINLGGIPNATDAEMNEIKNLLQNGVLL